MTIETWKSAAFEDELPKRPLGPALRAGLSCRCPACGKGKMFGKYLKVVPACEVCGEDLSHQRSDDAAPYFTIVIVGHIIVPLVLMVETNFHPVLWLQMTLWPTLALIMSLLLLQPIKGAVVGFQWARYMHGFDPRTQEGDDIPPDPALSVETA